MDNKLDEALADLEISKQALSEFDASEMSDHPELLALLTTRAMCLDLHSHGINATCYLYGSVDEELDEANAGIEKYESNHSVADIIIARDILSTACTTIKNKYWEVKSLADDTPKSSKFVTNAPRWLVDHCLNEFTNELSQIARQKEPHIITPRPVRSKGKKRWGKGRKYGE